MRWFDAPHLSDGEGLGGVFFFFLQGVVFCFGHRGDAPVGLFMVFMRDPPRNCRKN